MTIKQALPWGLVALRTVGGPLIVAAARSGWTGVWLGIVIVGALLSDIYDGVLARRWGCETPLLRLLDSLADTVFYLGVTWVLWMREPRALRDSWGWFAVLFSLEALRYAFDLVKFGKSASYHSYLAKAWGLLIVISVVGSLNAERLRVMIPLAVIFGILVNLEGLAMSAMLPRWSHDVKTLREAGRLRREMLGDQAQEHRSARDS